MATVIVAAAVPQINQYYGILRAMYVTMPVSLLAFAVVVGKQHWAWGGVVAVVVIYMVFKGELVNWLGGYYVYANTAAQFGAGMMLVLGTSMILLGIREKLKRRAQSGRH